MQEMRVSQADALARFPSFALLEHEEFVAHIHAHVKEPQSQHKRGPARFSLGLSSLMHGLADRFKHPHHGAKVRFPLTFFQARARC